MDVQFSVFTIAAGLLAFVLAFYALIAKEQRSPYITESIYSSIVFILSVITLGIISAAIKPWYAHASGLFISGSYIVLLVTVIFVIYKTFHIHNRHLNFRDDNLIKNTSAIRFVKGLWRKLSPRKQYEHAAKKFPNELYDDLQNVELLMNTNIQSMACENSDNELSTSIAIRVTSFSDGTRVIKDFLELFSTHDCWMQYISCGRHPSELVSRLNGNANSNSNNESWFSAAKKRLVAVDAYSSNYGFTDSIYEKWRLWLTREHNITVVKAEGSYAGLHTASAKAFNVIKKSTNKQVPGNNERMPALVIYESPYAISDRESVEQYKIFIRHVLPSERLMGGMFTVFIESVIPNEEWDLISSYVDVAVDLTQDKRAASNEGT